jgi:hypothetical protein
MIFMNQTGQITTHEGVELRYEVVDSVEIICEYDDGGKYK